MEADWPLATNEPEVGVKVNQGAEFVLATCQLNGQAQLPVPVIETLCELGLVLFCVALKATALSEGDCNVQGGSTSKLTVIVCGLPGAELPALSVPIRIT